MNLVAPIRVVVVDDKPTHLFSIVNGLTIAGIPCVWHLYDVANHKLTPTPPADGYPHLRVLISDLNIQEMSGANRDTKTLAGILITEVIKPLVAKDGGPYSLVLWTNVEAHAGEVATHIADRITAQHLSADDQRPAPLCVNTLAKGRFLPVGVDETTEDALCAMFNETAEKSQEFRRAVQDAVSSDSRLRLVSAWESRIGVAAASTMKSIHSIAVAETTTTASTNTPALALESILAKITVEAVGRENASENPSVGLDAGLLDLVVDELSSNCHAQGYADIVKETLADVIKANPSVTSDTQSRLNTHLHVEVSPLVRELVTRGAVFEIDEKTLNDLCGQTLAEMLQTEFLLQESSDDLRKEARIRLIEIGADCDHAQRKPRTIRLLLAAELPVEFLSSKQQNNLRKLERHDALTVLGPWKIDNRNCVLLVSLRKFVTTQEWTCPRGFKLLYRVRKPIADLLLYKYTTYSNRPGIVAITR